MQVEQGSECSCENEEKNDVAHQCLPNLSYIFPMHMKRQLESESHKVERLTQERDLVRSTFIALSNQLVESRITESQNGSTAKIGSAAIEPKDPSGPSVLVNSALAGIAGISLSILAILIYEWWNTNNKKTLAE